MKYINHILKQVDPNSLRVRLTIVIAALSAIGLGSLAIWTNWKVQHILIDSHKQNLQELTERLPQDVQVYTDMYSLQDSLEKSVKNLTNTNTFLWIKNQNKKILVTSKSFQQASDSTKKTLINLTKMPVAPQVHKIDQNYFILCSNTLEIKGKLIGELSVAHDITREQTMFMAMVQSSSVASLLVIMIISGAIAFYISRSLRPLRQVSRMTEVISVSDLGKAQLYFQNAPSEVKELAQTCNQMLMRLSESWEKERQFVSNISHELRTPLNGMIGFLKLILEGMAEDPEEQMQFLLEAHKSSLHLLDIINDILDISRKPGLYIFLNPNLRGGQGSPNGNHKGIPVNSRITRFRDEKHQRTAMVSQ